MTEEAKFEARAQALSDLHAMLQSEADVAKKRMDQLNAVLQGFTVAANLTAGKAMALSKKIAKKEANSEEVTPEESTRLAELESLHAEMRQGMQSQANECLLAVGRAEQAQASANMADQYSKLEEARAKGEDPVKDKKPALEVVEAQAG
jgi:hypothetical protein